MIPRKMQYLHSLDGGIVMSLCSSVTQELLPVHAQARPGLPGDEAGPEDI